MWEEYESMFLVAGNMQRKRVFIEQRNFGDMLKEIIQEDRKCMFDYEVQKEQLMTTMKALLDGRIGVEEDQEVTMNCERLCEKDYVVRLNEGVTREKVEEAKAEMELVVEESKKNDWKKIINSWIEKGMKLVVRKQEDKKLKFLFYWNLDFILWSETLKDNQESEEVSEDILRMLKELSTLQVGNLSKVNLINLGKHSYYDSKINEIIFSKLSSKIDIIKLWSLMVMFQNSNFKIIKYQIKPLHRTPMTGHRNKRIYASDGIAIISVKKESFIKFKFKSMIVEFDIFRIIEKYVYAISFGCFKIISLEANYDDQSNNDNDKMIKEILEWDQDDEKNLIWMQINKDSIRKFENIKFTELEIYEPLKNLEYGSILLAKNLTYHFDKNINIAFLEKLKNVNILDFEIYDEGYQKVLTDSKTCDCLSSLNLRNVWLREIIIKDTDKFAYFIKCLSAIPTLKEITYHFQKYSKPFKIENYVKGIKLVNKRKYN